MQVDGWSPELQTGGTRGLFIGGRNPSGSRDVIDLINVDSTGDSIDFGNLSGTRRTPGCFASRTRGVSCGGIQNPAYKTDIDVMTCIYRQFCRLWI